jgi:hypothetical protein
MRVLLLYPNLYGMNMLPPAIGLFTALLRRDGHEVKLFDTTVYEGLASVDSDKQKADNLNARPYRLPAKAAGVAYRSAAGLRSRADCHVGHGGYVPPPAIDALFCNAFDD